MPAADVSVSSHYPRPYSGYEAFEACFEAITRPNPFDWPQIALWATWLANPFFVVALISSACAWRRLSVIVSGSAAGIAPMIIVCFWPGVSWFLNYPAFWFWWGSMIVALLAAVFVLEKAPMPYADDFGPMKALEPRTPLSS
jgi:hypothetical protein